VDAQAFGNLAAEQMLPEIHDFQSRSTQIVPPVSRQPPYKA
jgi:hypothetical protein